MTTPFKGLNPFTPRFIEINYIAPDGGCCAMSSSSGSQQSFPDDPIPPPDPSFQYFFNSPSAGSQWMMWVQNPSNPAERVLITEFTTEIEGLIDITEFFYLPEMQTLPGTERKVFFTLVVSFTGFTGEEAYQTSFSDESGSMSLEAWNDVPEYEPLDGWVSSNDVQMVVIDNYLFSSATFNVVVTPIPD